MPLVYSKLALYAYGLVDRVESPTAPAGLEVLPVVPAPLRDSARLLPGLVNLSTAKADTKTTLLGEINRQIDDGEVLPLCALLRTEADPERIVQHLQQRLLVELDGAPCYFRFFDPRVLIQLEWLLTPPQLARLLGPITEWRYFLDGVWRVLERPDVVPAARWRPDPAQSQALHDMLIINGLIAQLPAMPHEARQRAGRNIVDLFARARQAGLHALADLQLFAWHGLTVHPRFDEHPSIRQVLDTLPEDADFPYEMAMSDMDDADFDRIKTDLANDVEMI